MRHQRTLLCLHGSPGSPEDFSALTALFPPTVLVSSPWRQVYTKTPLPPRADFVLGYSWGAVDALAYAANTPGIQGLILVSPYFFPKTSPSFLKRMLLKSPLVGSCVLKAAAPRAVLDFIHQSCAPNPVPCGMLEASRALRSPQVLRTALLEKGDAVQEIKKSFDTLQSHQTPIALIWGQADRTSDESTQINPIRKWAPHRMERSFAHAGHALPWTHPSAISEVIAEFIQNVAKTKEPHHG